MMGIIISEQSTQICFKLFSEYFTPRNLREPRPAYVNYGTASEKLRAERRKKSSSASQTTRMSDVSVAENYALNLPKLLDFLSKSLTQLSRYVAKAVLEKLFNGNTTVFLHILTLTLIGVLVDSLAHETLREYMFRDKPCRDYTYVGVMCDKQC